MMKAQLLTSKPGCKEEQQEEAGSHELLQGHAFNDLKTFH
jgi:hypothetical protein